MHFRVKPGHEIVENGSKFVVYDVLCNGVFHGAIRYSTFFQLWEALKDAYPGVKFPPFPPKKFKYKALSAADLDNRTSLLDRFFARIGENFALQQSELFQKFLLSTTKELREKAVKEIVPICVSDELTIDLELSSHELKVGAMKKLAEITKANEEFLQRFFMFVVAEKQGERKIYTRVLSDHESPYIARLRANSGDSVPLSGDARNVIVLRCKLFDDDAVREMLSCDGTARLLYHIILQDITYKWVKPQENIRTALRNYRKAQDYKNFVLTSLSTKGGLGRVVFEECAASIPREGNTVRASLSVAGVSMTVLRDQTEEVFDAVRIRCWKLVNEEDGSMSFNFDYLHSQRELTWVVLRSARQSVYMANMMQTVVEEILRSRVRAKQLKDKAEGGEGAGEGGEKSDAEVASSVVGPKKRIFVTEQEGKRVLTTTEVQQVKHTPLSKSSVDGSEVITPVGRSASVGGGGGGGDPLTGTSDPLGASGSGGGGGGSSGGGKESKLQVKRAYSSDGSGGTQISSSKKSGLAAVKEAVKDKVLNKSQGNSNSDNPMFAYGVDDDDL